MAEIDIKLTEIEQRSKSNTKRLDHLEERQDNMEEIVKAVSVLANEQEHVKEDVKEIKTDVKTLASQPAKKWESLTEKVITAIVGGIIGYLLFRLGLGA